MSIEITVGWVSGAAGRSERAIVSDSDGRGDPNGSVWLELHDADGESAIADIPPDKAIELGKELIYFGQLLKARS